MKSDKSIDDVRSFWDSRPCNIRHSSEPVGTKKYFDEVEARKYFVEPHIPNFASFKSWKDKRVLEIGCGIGTDAVNFAREGAIYTGVELSKESLKLARTRFELFDLPARLLEADAESVDTIFPHETFDLIYSFGVLHHTPDLQRALRALRALSTEKTLIKIMVYAKNSWKNAMINSGLDQPEAQYGCPIANTYSIDEITKEMNIAGFNVLNIKQDHIFPYIVEKYKKYEYVREEWFNAMPDEVFNALEESLGWHLLINAEIC